jgi:hypothetical protein
VIEGREGRLDDLFAVEADLLIQGIQEIYS